MLRWEYVANEMRLGEGLDLVGEVIDGGGIEWRRGQTRG